MESSINISRLKWDLAQPFSEQYSEYWKERNTHFIPSELFSMHPTVYLEIGAGTGWFLLELARSRPDVFFVGIERCRMRANRLVKRANRAKLPNVAAYRGNAIPAVIHGIPSESVDRLYILYPNPFPKNSQRKNRWYLHPIMPHLVRILKRGGTLVWASDQSFYIEEARFVCEDRFRMQVHKVGALSPHALNDLESFPEGRTKFEATFLANGVPCYELIVSKEFSELVCSPGSV